MLPEKRLLLPGSYQFVKPVEAKQLYAQLREASLPRKEYTLPTAYRIGLATLDASKGIPSPVEGLERKLRELEAWLSMPYLSRSDDTRVFELIARLAGEFMPLTVQADMLAAELLLKGGISHSAIGLVRRGYDLPQNFVSVYERLFFFTDETGERMLDTVAYESYAPSLANFVGVPTPTPSVKHAEELLDRMVWVSVASAQHTVGILETLDEVVLAKHTP